ncbi:MAG TPA: hypothetical protein VIT44_04715, partial [Cyclobacteriaceae bacterium]
SLYAELLGDDKFTLTIKTRIVNWIPMMILFMALTAFSGKTMGNPQSPLVVKKLARMKIIGATGVILILLAISLYLIGTRIGLNNLFTTLQVVELVLGLFNIINMLRMVQYGLQLSGRLKLAKH